MTGGEENGVKLQKKMFGKPYQATFEFAEKRLVEHREYLADSINMKHLPKLKRVYMIGGMQRLFARLIISFLSPHDWKLTTRILDNPESDILGANQYSSVVGSAWHSILVRSGVFSGGEPAHSPKAIVDDVWNAVQWGLKSSGWQEPLGTDAICEDRLVS